MPKFYGAIDLVQNELRQAVVQNLGTAPASPVKGQIYLNTTDNTLYFYNGTTWVASSAAAGGPPSGPAGGDLSGTYPNPTVLKAAGDFTVAGDILMPAATSQLVFNGAPQTYGRVQLPNAGTTPSDGINFGSSMNIYRGAANLLMIQGMNWIGFGNAILQNVGDPTAGTDAANKNYVDNLIQGLSWKNPCRVASTVNLAALSGLIAVDGVTVAAGDRVLVKNQTTQSANGVYVAAAGAWARAVDLDAPGEFPNAAVFVSEGTTQADTMWQQTTNAPVVIGTSNILWTQIGSASSYIGGAGLTLTGNTFDVGAGTGITVAADSVAVDTTTVAMKSDLSGLPHKYVTTLAGNVAYATGEQVIHSLNTFDVLVQVFLNAAPYTGIEVDVERTTSNMITVRYNPNIGAARCVVIG